VRILRITKAGEKQLDLRSNQWNRDEIIGALRGDERGEGMISTLRRTWNRLLGVSQAR